MISNSTAEADSALFEVPGGSLGRKESSGEVCIAPVLGEKYEEEASACVPANVFPGLVSGSAGPSDPDVCAICLDKIKLAETSQIKECEHSYCVTCILRCALYKSNTWCPQCRLPFTVVYIQGA
ncbi:uncharacterized protein [Physcomitrium patens]|uniref:RING-type domain-containing protein n=1 Tax=Physcomitrium patens TaxID=3218 RepID=A0A2K1KQD8_PHYPA|nr:uncharacterized protein LOC112281710 [Physcomitrium patens]PNR55971.1 hypothetical protein PHYPA_006868 [Physcomitrium patens]|eukprot:XP_024374301.1 uncharacterized protein LOC112281710 [Physcomitrella patens]